MRLEDMVESIDRIQAYVDGLDEAGFRADLRTIDAVVFRFAVLGEAAAAVPSEVRDRFPRIPWREAADMRNVLVHEYFGIRVETVWATLRDDLPTLRGQLVDALAESPEPA